MEQEKFGIKTKELMIKELVEMLGSYNNFFITNYKGLNSLEMENLRKELNNASSKYFVVKNSIAKRAFNELNLTDFGQFIKDEVGIGLIGDLIKTSKAVVDFLKNHSSFKLNCAFIDGKVEGADRIKYLAALPPREVLIGILLSHIKSPVTGFVGVLKGLLRNLVYAIDEIKNRKEKGDTK